VIVRKTLALMRDLRRIRVADPRPEVGVGVDLPHLDGPAQHARDDVSQLVG
jgi:hypothetical protein